MVTFNSNNPLVKKPKKKKRKVKGSTLGSGQLKSTLGAPGKGKKRKPSKRVAQPGTGANWKDLSAKDKVKYTIKGEGKNSVDANNNLNWADGEKKKPKVKVPKTSKTKIPRQSTTASTPTPVVSTNPIQPVEEVEVDVLETPKYSEVYKERKKIKKSNFNKKASEKINEIANEEGVIPDENVDTGDKELDKIINNKVRNHYHPEDNYPNITDVPEVELEKAQTPLTVTEVAGDLISSDYDGSFDPDTMITIDEVQEDNPELAEYLKSQPIVAQDKYVRDDEGNVSVASPTIIGFEPATEETFEAEVPMINDDFTRPAVDGEEARFLKKPGGTFKVEETISSEGNLIVAYPDGTIDRQPIAQVGDFTEFEVAIPQEDKSSIFQKELFFDTYTPSDDFFNPDLKSFYPDEESFANREGFDSSSPKALESAVDNLPCDFLMNDTSLNPEKGLSFNDSNFKAYGFWYNSRDGRIYANVAFDDAGLPQTIDKGLYNEIEVAPDVMNIYGEPAKSINTTKIISNNEMQIALEFLGIAGNLTDYPNFLLNCNKVKKWMKENAGKYNPDFSESATEKYKRKIKQANNISAELDNILGDLAANKIQENYLDNKDKVKTLQSSYSNMVFPLVADLISLKSDIETAKQQLEKGEIKAKDVNNLIRVYNATRQAFKNVETDFTQTKLKDLNTNFRKVGRDPLKNTTTVKGVNSNFKMSFDASRVDPTQPALILNEGNEDLTLEQILKQNQDLLAEQMLDLFEFKEKQEYAQALLDDLKIEVASLIPDVISEANERSYDLSKIDSTLIQDIALVVNRIEEYIVKFFPGLVELALLLTEAIIKLGEGAVGADDSVSSVIRDLENYIADATDEFIDSIKFKPGLTREAFDIAEDNAMQSTWTQGALLMVDVVGDILVTKGVGRISGLSKFNKSRNVRKAIIKSKELNLRQKLRLLISRDFPVMLPRVIVDRVNEVENLAETKDVQLTGGQRFSLVVVTSIVEAALDKVGLDYMLAKNGAGKLNTWVANRLLRKPAGETMQETGNRIIKQLVADGVLQASAKGTVFNIADEVVQEESNMLIQNIVDGRLDKIGQNTLYDNPEVFSADWWKRLEEVALVTAIGIGTVNTTINIASTYKTISDFKQGLQDNEEHFKKFSQLRNKDVYDANIKALEQDLDQEIKDILSREDISREEKENLINIVKDQHDQWKTYMDWAHEIFNKIDLELGNDAALTQYQLELELIELRNKLSTKPGEAETSKIKSRIKEIEKELSDLAVRTTEVTDEGVQVKEEFKSEAAKKFDEDAEAFKQKLGDEAIVEIGETSEETEALAKKYNLTMAGNPAQFTALDDGTKVFIFDKQMALENREKPLGFLGDHEYDHFMVDKLEEIFGPEITFKLAGNIINAVRNDDIIFASDEDKIAYLDLIERYEQLRPEDRRMLADEVIANMGDYLRSKKAKINKNIITKIKDGVTNAVNNLTNNVVNIDFKNNTEFEKFLQEFDKGKDIALVTPEGAEQEFEEQIQAVTKKGRQPKVTKPTTDVDEKVEKEIEKINQRFKLPENPLVGQIKKLLKENLQLAKDRPEGWRDKNKKIAEKIKELKAQLAQAEENLKNVRDYQESIEVEGKGKNKKVKIIDEVKYTRSGNKLTEDFEPLINKIATEKFDPTKKGFTKEQLINGLRKEFSELLITFDADLGRPLFDYINKNLRNRIPQIIDEAISKEVPISMLIDSDEVNAEQWASTAVETVEQKEEEIKKETKNLRRALGIEQGEGLYNETKNAVIESFGEKLPSVKSGKLKKALQDKFAEKLQKKVIQLIRQEGGMEPFLEKYGEQVYDLIDQQIFNKTFQDFIEQGPRLSPTETDKAIADNLIPKDTDREAGIFLYTKKPYNKQQWIDFNVRPTKGTIYTKEKQLANAIAKTLGKDATAEVLKETDVLDKYNAENRQQNEIDLSVEKVAEILGTDPSSRFYLKPDVAKSMLFDAVKNTMEQGGSLEVWDLVSEVLPEQIQELANEVGIPEMLDQGITQYKSKLKDDLNKGNLPFEDEVNKYLETITSKKQEVSMKQMDDYNQKITDEIDPAVLDAIGGKEFYGYGYTYLDDGEKGGKGSGVYGPFKKQADKIQAKRKKKSTGEFKLPTEDIRIINAGYKIIGQIETILKKDITKEEKLKQLEDSGLLDQLRKANKVNKEVLVYLMRKNASLLAKEPELIPGFLRSMEHTTNNTKSYRGLTTSDLLLILDGSQAKYWNPSTNKYTDNLTASQKKSKEWVPNPNHEYFQEARDLAVDEVEKLITLGKIDKNNDEKIAEEIDKKTADHLRNKGEHMAAAAPLMEELAKSVLIAAEKINQGENEQDVLDELDRKNRKTLRNYGQVIGPEVISANLDYELGTTNLSEYARTLIEKFPSAKYLVIDDPSSEAEEFIEKKVVQEEDVLEAIKKTEEVKPKNRFKLEESNVIDLEGDLTNEEVLQKMITLDKALEKARSTKPVKPKKARVFDFDDTIAHTNSKVFYTMPDGTKGILTAEEFAKQGDDIRARGGEFDFSDFNRVVEPKQGPLFELMKALQEAEGDRDLFILTARAPESADAIFEWLKSQGINIPRENVVGLGNSSPQAKSEWFINKYAYEGYNDFYFADDHLPNVQAVADVLSVVDVKSKTQQAKQRFVLDGEKIANKLFQLVKKHNKEDLSIDALKNISDIKAEIKGAKVKSPFLMPYSAQNFTGLLYKFLGKGEEGNKDWEFLQENLVSPYTRGLNDLAQYKNALISDYNALLKTFMGRDKSIPDLEDEVPGLGGYTYEDAIRILAWDKQGISVDGVPDSTVIKIKQLGQVNVALNEFADLLINITKGDGFDYPGATWRGSTILGDLMRGVNKNSRSRFLSQWNENIEVIFGKDNGVKFDGQLMNAIETTYGAKYREAFEDMLRRMKSGRNRKPGYSRLENKFFNWLNNSVGAVMFFNMRSGLLQTLSSANYINWTFNNPLKAASAFANQKQYWKDFLMLMNSDFLVDRRGGMKINISESEIFDAISTKENKAQAFLNLLLRKGFSITQMADSFAIASGGATYYRNRIKDLVKNKNMSNEEAAKQAYEEWTSLSRAAQQSSDAMEISAQQASGLGRVVLAFANTPMQYNRLIWKAVQDIKNGRGDLKSNLSRIAYYSAIQNMMFNALQNALFAAGDEDDLDERTLNTLNGMLDSLLRGMGVSGTILSAIKDVGLDLYDRAGKPRPEFYKAVFQALNIAPPLDVKVSKFVRGMNAYEYNMDNPELNEPFNIENPMYEAGALVIASITNVPLDRVLQKAINVKDAFEQEQENWKRIFLLMGWTEWQLSSKEEQDEFKEERKEAKHYEKAKDDPKLYNKSEQEDILRQHGMSEDEIKKLDTENKRVNAITNLQDSTGNVYTSAIPNAKSAQIEIEEEADKEVKAAQVKASSAKQPTIKPTTSKTRTTGKNNRIAPEDRTEQEKTLYDMSKQKQVDSLIKLNLNPKDYKYEGDRVKAIIDANK
jgi:hypothetical protein